MPDVIIPEAPRDGGRHRRSLLSGTARHGKLDRAHSHNAMMQSTNTFSTETKKTTYGNDSSFGVSMDVNHSEAHNNHHEHERNHEKHAQHLDATSERVLKVTCVISLVAWLLSIIILSIVTETSPFLIFVGMSPLLLTIVVTYMLVDKYHMDTGFLMVFPFIFTGVFLLLGVAGLLGPINYLLLSSVNIILGLVFEVILIMQHAFIHLDLSYDKKKEEKIEKKEEQSLPAQTSSSQVTTETTTQTTIHSSVEKLLLASDSDVEKFVASIEDKAKAINAVIGRVYSVRKGGSESLRKKIRIDPTHYNEFNELKGKTAAKRMTAALAILGKIRQKLSLLEKMELEILDNDEMRMLVNLNRQKDGSDRIIDVLAKNDSDPVKTYYEGAVQFCDSSTKDLTEAIEAKKNSMPVKQIPAKKKPIPARLISFAKAKAKKQKDKRKRIVI